MTIKQTLLSAAAATACAFAFGGAAVAQGQPPAQQQQAAPVTDEEIQQFAEADKKLVTISEKWMPKLQAAESTEEAEKMQMDAQTEMTQAIEAEGLSVQRYNEIYAAAQADPDLAARIQASA